MSAFVGKSLLGSTFVQDPNANYIKIDSVVFGETATFGYKAINSGDISAILTTCINDNKAAIVVYNWAQNVAYIKTGFNLLNTADYKVSTGYTTFIIKSRISAANIAYYAGTTFVPVVSKSVPISINVTVPPTQVNGFLKMSNSTFTLNGMAFVPVGMNAFFLGLLQETMNYPTHAQITEIFEAARKMKATVIRSHTLGFSAQSSVSLLDANNNFNLAAWDPIDWAYAEAKRCSIKLIIVMCDPYEYYHGSLNTFCAPYGIAKDQFFVDPTARDAFKKYLNGYLTHVNPYTKVAIKNCIQVAMIELGNELGDIRPNAGSTAIPTQDWIQDITSYIKSITPILVLDGCDESLGGPTSNDFAVSAVDCYSRHFYWAGYDQLNASAAAAANSGRPLIVGEYSSQFGNDWFNTIEAIPNVAGSLAWSIYCHTAGTSTSPRVVHGDGFDFWWDFNTDTNNIALLNLTNHFRRMQKLPMITMGQMALL